MNERTLNLRYILIQSFYCMLICTMSGYASVFLLDKGFNNTVIGSIIAVSNILAVLGQQFLANFMDKTTKISLRILIMGLITVIILLSLFLFVLTKPSLLMLIIITIIFTMAPLLLPFINSLVFIFETHGIHINFGLARGIGSASYALASLFFGNLIALYNPNILPCFYILFSFTLLLFVYSFKTPSTMSPQKKRITHSLSLTQFIKKYNLFMILLVAIILLLFNFNIINIFLFQILQHNGGNNSHLGIAMFLAAAVELPTMAIFNKIQRKYNEYTLTNFAALFFTIKNILTFVAVNVSMIYLAQALQMVSFAIFLPASIYLVRTMVEPDDLIKGQALMTGAMSISSVFASLIGGVLLDATGVSNTLLIGTIISSIGTLLVLYTIKKIQMIKRNND